VSGLLFESVSAELGGRRVLEDVSFETKPGELLILLGPNGAGKTSLLRAALGLLRLSRGKVSAFGRDVLACAPRERARDIGWLPQQQMLSERVDALDVVLSGRYRFHEPKSVAEEKARSALARLGVAELERRVVTELSGGERQRVALATLLAQEARFALLDEPGNHLDPAQQLETYRFIGELSASGLGVVLVSHDVNLPRVVDPAHRARVVGLREGRVLFTEPASSPELPRRLSELYGVEFRVLAGEGERVLVATPKSGGAR
jgi:iron complex transport system ATP-binding protein